AVVSGLIRQTQEPTCNIGLWGTRRKGRETQEHRQECLCHDTSVRVGACRDPSAPSRKRRGSPVGMRNEENANPRCRPEGTALQEMIAAGNLCCGRRKVFVAWGGWWALSFGTRRMSRPGKARAGCARERE